MATPPDRLPYLLSCVSSRDVAAIINMVDESREITRRTFRRRVRRQDREELEKQLGYGHDFRITQDWHVRYFSSRWRGRPCVYLMHSCIEYVFAAGGKSCPRVLVSW